MSEVQGIQWTLNLFPTFFGNMCVNLRRFQRVVSQYFLNISNISAPLQQMSGKAMTQGVHRRKRIHFGRLHRFSQDRLHTAGRILLVSLPFKYPVGRFIGFDVFLQLSFHFLG